MRYAFLIALREYAENVKTKGFWIGILLFPIILLAFIKVPQFLEEKATPVRYFVLLDQTGELEGVVDEALEHYQLRRVMQALGEYGQKYSRFSLEEAAGGKSMAEVLEETPASGGWEQQLQSLVDANSKQLQEFVDAGGLVAALDGMKPYLKEDAPEFEEPRQRFRKVALPTELDPNADLDESANRLKAYLAGDKAFEVDGEKKELFAAVLIPEDIFEHVKRPVKLDDPGAMASLAEQASAVQYWSTNLADEDLRGLVERKLNEEVRRREYLAKGVDEEVVREIRETTLPFSSLDPKKEEGEEEVSQADRIRQYAPIAFVYLLWVSVMQVAAMLLNNTVEEKSNRIVEVLLSSVTPGELMAGKLLGIAAVGVTMLLAWIASLVGILYWQSGPEAEIATAIFTVVKTSGLLPAFLIYFILGYLLYAGIFLAIGSVCNTIKEAQNFMGPVMVIMMVPILTMMFIPKDPNGTLATVLSWIPLYTPFVMMNRAAANPPTSELIGTTALTIVSIVVILWLSGKVFRVGILRTGQPPKLKELLGWIKAKA